jgi:H+/gluconate symporter-like permease
MHKKIAMATLFLPSILFWGVSLLKDPICVGAMGFFIYAAYNAFIKREKVFKSLISVYISGLLLIYFKPYILICLSAVFVLWIFFRFREKIKDKTLRTVSTSFFIIMALGAGFFLSQSLAQSEATEQLKDSRQPFPVILKEQGEGALISLWQIPVLQFKWLLLYLSVLSIRFSGLSPGMSVRLLLSFHHWKH